MPWRFRSSFGILAILGLCFAARPILAADTDAGANKVYQRVIKSTVCVLSLNGNRVVGVGTGAVIDAKQKLVLTNFHVVMERENVVILFPEYQKNKSGKMELVAERPYYMKRVNELGIPGKVIDKKSECDLALVKLASMPEGVSALPIAPESPSPGDRIHCIGNAGVTGGLWIYTPGSVRQVYNRKFRTSSQNGQNAFEIDARIVATDAAVNPGDSGGPVVNDRAELVGITQGHAPEDRARLLSFAIDIHELQRLPKAKGIKFTTLAASGGSRPSTGRPATVNPTSAKLNDDAVKREQVAVGKFNRAQTLADDGKVDKAIERCQEIIKDFPDTEAAKGAKLLLEKLKQ